MSKQIIIDWQRDGLFVATGSRRGNSVTIDTLITTGGEEGGSGSSTAISTQLYALAKQFDLHKAEATVIAPRELLEFRTLTVPRGEAGEIPDMVRFQAQRQMANIGDTWALDYILLPEQAGQEGISALATTISPAHMAEIEATCSDLGIHLTRVLARPVEIARWGVAAGALATTEVGMIVALSQTHADLLIVSLGNLIQLRGTRLPEDPAAAPSALVSEIRRSMLAASSFVNNQPVTKILLIAAPDLAERVEASVAQATGASVAVIDPATMLPASLPERHEIAQRSANRLAAIAGVLSNPAPDKRDVIDLKNFKRREPKKSKKRQNLMIGGAVGVLALMGLYAWWSANASIDSAIAAAIETEKQTKNLVETSSKLIKQREEVDQFLGGAINWLDELSYVATKLPPAEQVMLGNPTLTLMRDNSGQISFTLDAKDAQTILRVQQDLTDKNHAVSGSGSQKRPTKSGEYSWTAAETMRVTPEGWDPLATQPKTTAAKSTDSKSTAARTTAARATAANSAAVKTSDGAQPSAAPASMEPVAAAADPTDQPEPSPVSAAASTNAPATTAPKGEAVQVEPVRADVEKSDVEKSDVEKSDVERSDVEKSDAVKAPEPARAGGAPAATEPAPAQPDTSAGASAQAQ